MKKELWCLVGLPRSGKSTWATKMGSRDELDPIVSKDAIRLALHGERFLAEREDEVHEISRVMIHALFLAGHRIVVLDETNTTIKRRNQCRSKYWTVRFKVFSTPKEECIRRALKTSDSVIIPVIERMAKQFEPLTPEEKLLEI
jgi:predicted kinase